MEKNKLELSVKSAPTLWGWVTIFFFMIAIIFGTLYIQSLFAKPQIVEKPAPASNVTPHVIYVYVNQTPNTINEQQEQITALSSSPLNRVVSVSAQKFSTDHYCADCAEWPGPNGSEKEININNSCYKAYVYESNVSVSDYVTRKIEWKRQGNEWLTTHSKWCDTFEIWVAIPK